MLSFKRTLVLGGLAGIIALALVGGAKADDKIYTGGEKGSYYTSFGPLLKDVLAKQFFKYEVVASAGSVENIKKVVETPSAIGLVQSDVLAYQLTLQPDLADKITILRNDVANECVYAVTAAKNADRLQSWGDVISFGRRLKIVTGPIDSGSAGTLQYLRTIDESLKDIPFYTVDSIDSAIDDVVKDKADIAVFVQFADTTNPRFKVINDNKLAFIPVIDRAMLRQQINKDTPVYAPQEVKVTGAGIMHWRGTNKITTACAPITYITGNPSLLPSGNAQTDLKDLIEKVQKVDVVQLRPKENWFKQVIESSVKATGGGLEALLQTAEKAAKAIHP